jgi:hypothetical protein
MWRGRLFPKAFAMFEDVQMKTLVEGPRQLMNVPCICRRDMHQIHGHYALEGTSNYQGTNHIY